MISDEPEHTLEFLLAFDGRVHWLESGHWIKFEIRRVDPRLGPAARAALFVHTP